MPRLNRSLVTSIVADIGESARVAEEIRPLLAGVEHPSWKYPGRIAAEVDATRIVRDRSQGTTAGEFYVLLLELAYDRINYVLRLIVEFLEKSSSMEDDLNRLTGDDKPGLMTIGTMLPSIWNHLKCLVELNQVNSSNVKNGEEGWPRMISRGSQTGTGVGRCGSCSTAAGAILRVINAIEGGFRENKLISVAAAEREHSKGDIYERTQWAVMNRLADGIEADVKTFTAMMSGNDLRAKARTVDTAEDSAVNAEKRLEETRLANLEILKQNEMLKEKLEDVQRRFSLLAEWNNILQSQAASLAEGKFELENSVRRLETEVIGPREQQQQGAAERRFRFLLTESKRASDSMRLEYETEMERWLDEMRSVQEEREAKKIKRSISEKECQTGTSTVEKGNQTEASAKEKRDQAETSTTAEGNRAETSAVGKENRMKNGKEENATETENRMQEKWSQTENGEQEKEDRTQNRKSEKGNQTESIQQENSDHLQNVKEEETRIRTENRAEEKRYQTENAKEEKGDQMKNRKAEKRNRTKSGEQEKDRPQAGKNEKADETENRPEERGMQTGSSTVENRLAEKRAAGIFWTAKVVVEEQEGDGSRGGGGGGEPILMPGDDPEADMASQLISNREKIERLSRQNERLSRTLARLSQHRRTANLSGK